MLGTPPLVQHRRESAEADLAACLDEENEDFVVRRIRGPVGNAEAADEFGQSDASMRNSLVRGDRSTIGSSHLAPAPVRRQVQPAAIPRCCLVDKRADVDQIAVRPSSCHALLEPTVDARANCEHRCSEPFSYRPDAHELPPLPGLLQRDAAHDEHERGCSGQCTCRTHPCHTEGGEG